jgi:hypothetical protein
VVIRIYQGGNAAVAPKLTKRRKFILIAGTLIGIPAVALAANFVIGLFTGGTVFEDSTTSATIAAVSGTRDPASGVDCTSATRIDTTSFTVDPSAVRLTAPASGDSDILPGACEVGVEVFNSGDVPVTAAVVADAVPTGWTVAADPITVETGGTRTLTVVIGATEDATAGDLGATITAEAAPYPAPVDNGTFE